MAAVPHEVDGNLGISDIVATVVSYVASHRGVADLQQQVVPRSDVESTGDAKLVAGDVVPEFRAIVQVNRCPVILITADPHDLLSSSQSKPVGGLPVDMNPVRGIEEGAAGEFVETLSVAVGETLADLSVKSHVKETSPEAGGVSIEVHSRECGLIADSGLKVK